MAWPIIVSQIPWHLCHWTVYEILFPRVLCLSVSYQPFWELGSWSDWTRAAFQKTKLVYSPPHFWLALSVRHSCCCLLGMHRKSIHLPTAKTLLLISITGTLPDTQRKLPPMLLHSSRLPSATPSAFCKHQAISREKSASSRLFRLCVWLLFRCGCTMIIWIRWMNVH